MIKFRREPRIQEQADVSIRVRTAPLAKELEGRNFSSRSENISMSGMKLNTDIPIPVGSVLDLKILLKNSPIKYEIMANVVWSNLKNALQDFVGEVGVTLTIEPNSKLALWNAAVSDL
jgi:Tfp pilus assembly protein PilZ